MLKSPLTPFHTVHFSLGNLLQAASMWRRNGKYLASQKDMGDAGARNQSYAMHV